MSPQANARKSASDVRIVLGLHFGHDAAVAVTVDGAVRSYVLRERLTRVKHALGLDMNAIETALAQARITAGDIDCVAVSSTQSVELVIDEPNRLSIEFSANDPFDRPLTMATALGARGHAEIAGAGGGSLMEFLYDERMSRTFVGKFYANLFPAHLGRRRSDFHVVPWLDTFVEESAWRAGPRLSELGGVVPSLSDRLRYGFHVPLRVTLDGIELPGYAVHHHLAHAASSYFQSGFESAAILTHDGFGVVPGDPGYNVGMLYLGDREAIYPLSPHHLTIGFLYEYTANALGLGVVGGAGKLMGLAAYGEPRFFDERFVGNSHDFPDVPLIPRAWLTHCREQARKLGYPMEAFGDPAKATDPVNADIAASTQLLFEETRLAAVRALHKQLENVGREVENLCLSGGTALNCPSNTRISQSGPFERVFVEPMCDDGGIAIGAALGAYHSILGNPLSHARTCNPSPYLGGKFDRGSLQQALLDVAGTVTVEDCDDAAHAAAADLVNDKIVGWYEGGSEAGPRALGHRSILADPRNHGNWSRVNKMKGREQWRPLAPAVLERHAEAWFADSPHPSPYMLFNARVKSDAVPAVTHVDGTARIQTVNESNGEYYRVINRFYELTGVPVVLNTSLNGPGSPIVERPSEAVALLLEGRFEVLYLDGRRVTSRVPARRVENERIESLDVDYATTA